MVHAGAAAAECAPDEAVAVRVVVRVGGVCVCGPGVTVVAAAGRPPAEKMRCLIGQWAERSVAASGPAP